MRKRSRYNFWIDERLREGLQFVYVRDGILPSEQIRRAIHEWLTKKGLDLKSIRPFREEKTRNQK
jgi:hypothetical protein